MNNQKGFANIFLIGVIVVLVAVVGYFALVKKSGPIVQQPTPTQTPTDETTDWKTYLNNEYKFEFKYPETENLGYLHIEGGAFLGSLSDKAAQNWASNLLIGTESGPPILYVQARKDKIDHQINLDNARIQDRTIFKPPVEIIHNGNKFTKYGTVSGEVYNLAQVIYSAENNGVYYVLHIGNSEIAKNIFLTFELR